MERSELLEDRHYESGCNSGSPHRDAVGSLEKKLVGLWNSILPKPRHPSAQLPKLTGRTAFKKAKHTVSRWYTTVYIPWFVASYDTHNGKHWLNSNPPSHRGCTYFGSTLLLLPAQSVKPDVVIIVWMYPYTTVRNQKFHRFTFEIFISLFAQKAFDSH